MTEEDGMDDLETDEGQQAEDFRRRLDFRNSVQDEYMESETSEGRTNEMTGSVSGTDKFGFIQEDKHGTELVPVDKEIFRRREGKWLEMFGTWDEYMMKNYKKVRDRCRKGIPGSVRARAWLHLCGAQFIMMNPHSNSKYRKLTLTNRAEERWLTDIRKDLHRNFPTHEMFGGAYEHIGQEQLFNVLKAYSVLNPVIGYCQAQAPIASVLLMHMPAESAFWTLVTICDKYIPGYYSEGMEAIQLDGDILFGLLKKVSPDVYRHLKVQGVDPILYMTEWFLCLFSRSLPWSSVLRIWDMFFCEGVKVLFKVGLVLLKYSLPRSARAKCPTMYETLSILKNIPADICREEFLIPEILKLNVTEDDMEREHRKQKERRKRLETVS